MELVQVEVIGLMALERAFEFGFGAGGVARLRLARHEDLGAIELAQRRAHFDLALAVLPVGRRVVEVVDALLEGLAHDPVRPLLVQTHQRQAGKADDRDLAPGSAEHTAGQAGHPTHHVVRGLEVREQPFAAQGSGAGRGAQRTKESAAFHELKCGRGFSGCFDAMGTSDTLASSAWPSRARRRAWQQFSFWQQSA